MKTTREWEDKKNAIWTYGSRLGEGRVGAVRGQSRTQAIRGWPGIRDWPGYNLKIKNLSKQLSTWIFIVPKSEVYEKDVASCADSPPTLQFAI